MPVERARTEPDLANVRAVESRGQTDALNSAFYGRFPFPSPCQVFTRITDPQFWVRLLAQELGEWTGARSVKADARIWVAGCGTNQAVITALNFPQARVIGSDIAAPSLEIARQSARSLGVTNLELRRQSINEVDDVEGFDYIICTGVIHHNAEPSAALATLSRAIKKTGVIELMIYNRYHRLQTTAFQRVIQLLHGSGDVADFSRVLDLSRRAIRGFSLPGSAAPVMDVVGSAANQPAGGGARTESSMSALLQACRDVSEVALADALFQPVEQSYTVESMSQMCEDNNLALVVPCVDQFDRTEGRISWNTEFADPVLREIYEALPDLSRWQITNLMAQERSPRLWFHVRRRDSPIAMASETQLCREFLARRFVRTRTECRSFVRNEAGAYREALTQPFPRLQGDPRAQDFYRSFDDTRTMAENLEALQRPRDLMAVNTLRICLTTQAFPFLTCAPGDL